MTRMEREEDLRPEMSNSMMGHDMSHHHHGQQHHETMQMYFHFGLGDQLLFSRLVLDSNLKLTLACLALFFGAILAEALGRLRGLRCRCQLAKLSPFRLIAGLGKDGQPKMASGVHNHAHRDYGSSSHVGGGRLCCSSGGQTSGPNKADDGYGDVGNPDELEHYRRRSRSDSRAHQAHYLRRQVHCELGLFRCEKRTYRLAQTAIQMIRTCLTFTLMLAAMTYNVCLIFAIILVKISREVGFMWAELGYFTLSVTIDTFVCIIWVSNILTI